MGGVILGMPGSWAKNFHESSNYYTTKIGGLPDWPFPEKFIKPELLKCVLCGERLCLVAQIYAPISTPKSKVDERVIYIFGCLMTKCGSCPRCWRALRAQKCNGELFSYENFEDSRPSTNFEEKNYFESENGVSLEENLVCGNEVIDEAYNDLNFDELARQLSDVSFEAFKSEKQKGSLTPKVPKQSIKSKHTVTDLNYSLPVIPCFYIYPQEDRSFGDVAAAVSNFDALQIEGCNSTTIDKEEEVWEGETYEYDKALGADRTYLKFKKRIDAYPEQCFRYSYGGKPLFVKPELKGPNPCNFCGSPRQYEMQLMPPLLYFLHEAADGLFARLPEAWNWTTLLVYTCSSNCCECACKDHQLGSCCWAVAEEAIIIQED